MVSLVNLVLKHKAVHVSFGLTKQLVIYWALSSCCKSTQNCLSVSRFAFVSLYVYLFILYLTQQ